VAYLLLADDRVYRCRTGGDLAERLVWAHRQGFRSAKASRTAWEEDRPLLPSEAAALVAGAGCLFPWGRPSPPPNRSDAGQRERGRRLSARPGSVARSARCGTAHAEAGY
jgi:hypothetical protein